jgi:hypothetical protein
VTNETHSTTELLAASLVVAFPRFVEGKLASLGVEPDTEVVKAAEAGCISLGHALNELVYASLPMQSESPLQLVRMATQPIAEALAAAGVPVPMRDERAVEIHPEDVYDLYPASSRELGDDVWQLQMQWGLEKARVVAGMVPAPAEHVTAEPSAGVPAVALFGLGRESRDAISASLAGLGYEPLVWRNPAALASGVGRSPTLVLVDLAHPGAHEAIRVLVAADVRVVAVGAHVDDLVAPGIMALGAQEVIQLDRLLDRLPDLLPRIV